MDEGVLASLQAYLNTQIIYNPTRLDVDGCDHRSMEKSAAWLVEHGYNVWDCIDWLRWRGAFCDCNVAVLDPRYSALEGAWEVY